MHIAYCKRSYTFLFSLYQNHLQLKYCSSIHLDWAFRKIRKIQFLLILSVLSMFQLHLIFESYNVQCYDNTMLLYFMPIIFRHLSQILVILLMLCISHIVAEVVRHWTRFQYHLMSVVYLFHPLLFEDLLSLLASKFVYHISTQIKMGK